MSGLAFFLLLPVFSLGHAAGTGWGRGVVRRTGPFGGEDAGFWRGLAAATLRPGCASPFCASFPGPPWRLLPFSGLAASRPCCRDLWRLWLEGAVVLCCGLLALSPAGVGALPWLVPAFWCFGLLSAADRVSGEAPAFGLFVLFWTGLLVSPFASLHASAWGAFVLWALFVWLMHVSARRGGGFQGFGEGDVLCAAALGAWLGPLGAFFAASAAGALAGGLRMRNCPFVALLCGFGAVVLGGLPWWA